MARHIRSLSENTVQKRSPPHFFWIGSERDYCSAVWHPPVGDVDSNIAVLIVPSLGMEQLRGRYDLRILAERLAAEGIGVIRWDLPGTSNGILSKGAEKLDFLTRFQKRLVEAVGSLKSNAGVADVVVVGRRIGALLTAACGGSLSAEGIVQTILWDPCVSGRGFLRELKLRESARLPESLRSQDVISTSLFEADGFAFDNDVYNAIYGLRLSECSPPGIVDVLSPVASTELASIAEKWRSERRAANVGLTLLPDSGMDVSVWEGPCRCGETITSIVNSIKCSQIPLRGESIQNRVFEKKLKNTVRFEPPNLNIKLVETAIRGGSNNQLFGIYATSVFDVPISQAVLLLGTGAEPCAGRGDSNAKLARTLAANGLPSMRMDFSGIGESALMSNTRDNVAYDAERAIEVAKMAKELRELSKPVSIVVIGICTGGYFGIHAAASGSIDRVIAVNPQLYWDGTAPSDWSGVQTQVYGERVVSAISDSTKWRKLLAGHYSFASLKEGAAAVIKRVLESMKPQRFQTKKFGSGLPRLDFRKAFDSRTQFDLIFSRDDLGYAHLIAHGPRAMRQLTKSGKVRLHIMDRVDHTFSTVGQRKRLDEKILELLLENR